MKLSILGLCLSLLFVAVPTWCFVTLRVKTLRTMLLSLVRMLIQVALVGLLDGYPYEIFTGLADDEEGIYLPKNLTKGKIIKQVNPDGSKRYDFQFENRRGYKTTVEGLSEKFNPEYWNYAKLISGVLRYRMPIEHVIKLVASLSLKDESINTWKTGVERALKKYAPGAHEEDDAALEE